MVSKAAMASPDSDEEYLDDPIQLIDFEQKRVSAAVTNYNSVNADPAFEVTDSEGPDLYIEKNINVSKKSFPRFKKVAITLPVTFFEISRNVEQLNRCKPLSIKVVNCKEYPWYYKKYLNSIDISADSEVEFYSESRNQPKQNGDDVMITERSKIKIRPVTSPYQNLKAVSSKNAICEPKESKHPESVSKDKLQNSLNQMKDAKVDFKRNQGLIGMKITQTQETPRTVDKEIKSKLGKPNHKTLKLKSSKDKTTTSTNCKSKNISSTDLLAINEKDYNDTVVKCTEDTKQDKTLSATNSQDSYKILNSLKTDCCKVGGDRAISHKTNFVNKIQLVQEDNSKVLQNNSKPSVNENKCVSSNKESAILEDNVKLVTSRDASSKANVQSAFFTENHDVKKAKLTKDQSKQKLNEPNSINFTGCKVKRKAHLALKISNDGENNKSNTIIKHPLHVLKTIKDRKDKIDKVKETSKGYNYVEMAGKESVNSLPLNTTTNGNSVLNMKLVKPNNKEVKYGHFSKTVQFKNQMANFVSSNVAKANLINEHKHNINIKHTFAKIEDGEDKSTMSAKSTKLLGDLVKSGPVLAKNYNIMDKTVQKINNVNHNLSMNLNDAQKEKTTTTIRNNIKLLDESVKTPVIVKNYSKIDISYHKKNVANCQSSSDWKNEGKQSIDKRNTNAYTSIDGGNKIHTSAFYIEKYAKIMKKPNSQQNLSDVTLQIQTSLENEPCNNKNAPKKTKKNSANKHEQKPANQFTSYTAVSNQPASNNPIQAETKDPRKLDTIDLACNSIQVKKLPTNIHSNMELTCSSVPNATPIYKSTITTCQSGALIATRVTTDGGAPRHIQSVRNQPHDIAWNNFAPQPCTLQIPLNIPSEPKRCPRVKKISRNNPETTESILQNNKSFDNISSHLQLAQNSLNNIQFSQPFKNYSTPAPQFHNQNQGQPYLPNFENIPQQKPPVVQQNQQAINSQMLAHYYANAQQLFERPPMNQSLMLNQNNIQFNAGDISRQLPTLQQNIPQTTTTKTPGQEPNHLLMGQSYKIAPDMLPPTCDIDVIQTLPRYDLNAETREFKPRQPPKKFRPHILLRKVIPKQQLIHRFNVNSAPMGHEVPQNVYTQNFGYSAQPHMQPHGQEFQQQHFEFSKIPPQNYIHCAPIYEGLPSNMNSANSVPYGGYWNNYYPTMLPPPPPPPPYHQPVQPHQQQLMPSTSQTCASFHQPNCITSTPKSVTGTTVIGCNYAGPVRKINILAQVSEASSMNFNNIQPQIIEAISQSSEIINNNGNKSELPTSSQRDQIVNSKREMLEELSKITTIESSMLSPVNDFKRPHPSLTTDEVELNLLKRPLLKPNATKENANELNKSMHECDSKRDKDNLIKRPLPEFKVKQQKTNLPNKPVSKFVAKHEESASLKRQLPTNNEKNVIKTSKPGPLSKKLNLNAISSPKRTEQIPVAHKGYSPPILPIPTYQKSLEILARSNIADPNLHFQNNYETIPNTTRRYSCEQKQDKLAKKISLDEYKKRCKGDVKVGELHVERIKIEIKSENSEQDLGYDSDCTSKH